MRNGGINQNLEAMAQAIFKNIFDSDFDCVQLGEVVKTTSGGTPSRKHSRFYENASICWVKSKELTRRYINDTEEKISEISLNYSAAKLLPSNSVLIAMYGATVGEFGIISKPMACNQAICALVPNTNYPYTYLFLFTKLHKEKLSKMAVGSAQQNISQMLIKKLSIHKNINKIRKLHSIVDPLFRQIIINEKEISLLKQIRDTLLPKLMSGEIRVPMEVSDQEN